MLEFFAALFECLANAVETFWPGDRTVTKAVVLLVMIIAMIAVVTVSTLGNHPATA